MALVAAGLEATNAAAHSISGSLLRLTFMAAVAVGMATVPPVSRAAGRADGPDALWSAGAAWSASGWVVAAYTDEPAVGAAVPGVLSLVLVVLLLDGVQVVLGFALTAVKHALPSLGLFVVVFGVLVVCAPAVSDAHGSAGLWAGLALANLALVAVQGALLLRRARSFAGFPGRNRTSGLGSGVTQPSLGFVANDGNPVSVASPLVVSAWLTPLRCGRLRVPVALPIVGGPGGYVR